MARLRMYIDLIPGAIYYIHLKYDKYPEHIKPTDLNDKYTGRR